MWGVGQKTEVTRVGLKRWTWVQRDELVTGWRWLYLEHGWFQTPSERRDCLEERLLQSRLLPHLPRTFVGKNEGLHRFAPDGCDETGSGACVLSARSGGLVDMMDGSVHSCLTQLSSRCFSWMLFIFFMGLCSCYNVRALNRLALHSEEFQPFSA